MAAGETAAVAETVVEVAEVTEPDWFFSFAGDGAREFAPPGGVVDALEFAKATLAHEMAGIRRTCLHQQSLMRRAHAEGMPTADIAVFSGFSQSVVAQVLDGRALDELLLGGSSE